MTLKKRGVNYIGLCPFHNDSHPSFSVSPTRGICHCFTCGKGGNAINFLMELEQMTYPDALRWLAKKYHIEIKERELTNEEKQRESERESMFIVNEWAAKYFQDILQNDVDGRAIGMLPVVGCAPEWMSEKAVSIGNYVVATGIDTYLGVEPYVSGSTEVTGLLTNGVRDWVEAAYTVEKDIDKLGDAMLARIEEKRAALGV